MLRATQNFLIFLSLNMIMSWRKVNSRSSHFKGAHATFQFSVPFQTRGGKFCHKFSLVKIFSSPRSAPLITNET